MSNHEWKKVVVPGKASEPPREKVMTKMRMMNGEAGAGQNSGRRVVRIGLTRHGRTVSQRLLTKAARSRLSKAC